MKNWIGGALLLVGLILHFGLGTFNATIVAWRGTSFFISDFIFLAGIAVAGKVIIKNGFRALQYLNLSIDLLMTSAIIGSILASIFGGKHIFLEGATLAFLYNFAELLEDYSVQKARGSLRELKNLSPDTATVKRNGSEETLPVEEVEIGDTVAIKPGSRVPVDGTVLMGETAVNEAPITGESIPVDKSQGDEV